MKIIRLEAENVKRLKAVRIDPDGSVVVIRGKNGAGKTSVLDAIEMALSGKRSIPTRPVRDGEEQAVIVADLGDLVVRRTINRDGTGSLQVTDRDGAKMRSPQAVLDRLTGQLTFDPLEFARMKPVEQAETVRRLTGLDFRDVDTSRAELYESRTAVNRQVRDLKGRLEAMPIENAPSKEVSISELTQQVGDAHETNRRNDALRADVLALDRKLDEARAECGRLRDEINDCRSRLLVAENNVEARQDVTARARADADRVTDIDTAPLQEQIAAAEETNAAVRRKASRAAVQRDMKERTAESDGLTERIDSLDAEKQRTIEEAEYPIDGLGFDGDGLTLQGVPFDQASAAEKLKTSVAMGLALNPELRILLIRDGSLLDQDSLRIIAEMAEAADGQVWLEMVAEDGSGGGVYIQDGEVA